MKKILRVYSLLTTVALCTVMLCTGIMIAKNNTRKLSFGEEYEAVQIYNTNSERIGICAGDKSIEVSKDFLEKTKRFAMAFEPIFSPVVNNFNWLNDSLTEIFGL
ncbi:MAG: hypothetical protein WBK75_05160 [Acutalibacteraceae bacterium]|jgi:hypothetical protein|nr:hypothetical protein [Clostridiales bacterium]